jgi:hypothetical protein
MKIVVFDLDETLGYFSEFGIFWNSLSQYLKSKDTNTNTNTNTKVFTQEDFNNILDLYPEFLRPNIINILTYLNTKKTSKCCDKMMIYTNNNGPREWCHNITGYFETKIGSKLFDQIIAAFKINGKQVEICRTTHSKTHDDFIRCTKVPENADICFLDDTFHPGMANERIYYINVKPYYHDIPFSEMVDRFIESETGKQTVEPYDFKKNIMRYINSYNYRCITKTVQENEVDEIVGKHIVTHLQKFFNSKPKRNKTEKKIKSKKKKTFKSRS